MMTGKTTDEAAGPTKDGRALSECTLLVGRYLPNRGDFAAPLAQLLDLVGRYLVQSDPAAVRSRRHDVPDTRKIDLAQSPPAWRTPDLRILTLHRRMPPQLPLDVFGSFWGPWIEQAAAASVAPPDYVAGPLLAAASTLIGNARWAQGFPGWAEPPHLWVASVGESGGSKSPAADRVLSDLIPPIERNMQRHFPDRLAAWQADQRIAKAGRDAWQKRLQVAARAGAVPPAPPANLEEVCQPRPPVVRCDDTTIEAIAQILAGSAPKGILMVRDELAGHLSGMHAYNPAARAFWLEAYGGRAYRVDRIKHGEPIIVRHLTCAWWGGIQPGRLADVLREPDDGLLARFLWFWPEPQPFDIPKVAFETEAAIAAFLRLSELEMQQGSDGPGPILVPLDPAAHPDLTDMAREAQDRQRFAGQLMVSSLGKARGLALRLSLILEYLWWAGRSGDAPPPAMISRQAFHAATRLVFEYALPMAERTFGDAAAPKADRDAATLARWIAKTRPEEIHGRALQRDVRLPGLGDAPSIRAAAEVLVEEGWLLPRQGSEQRGRPRVG